jgi:hypothetical protein
MDECCHNSVRSIWARGVTVTTLITATDNAGSAALLSVPKSQTPEILHRNWYIASKRCSFISYIDMGQ